MNHNTWHFNTTKTSITILLIVILASCRVQYDSPRVNKTETKKHSGNFSEYEISSYIRQKPNKKILFVIPFHLGVHNMASHLKDRSPQKSERIDRKVKKQQNKPGAKGIDYIKIEKKRKRTFRSWLMHTIGEAPVLLDSNLTQQTVRQMQLYLKTTGHFNPIVEPEVTPKKKGRTCEVTYHIYGGTPYTISKFEWKTIDMRLQTHLESIMQKSLIQGGMQYNEDKLDAERDRITTELRSIGYFHFSKSFISYTADTTIGNYGIDLTLHIKPFQIKTGNNPEDIQEKNHPRSKVGTVTFNMDFRHDGQNTTQLDTTSIVHFRSNSDTIGNVFYFVFEEKLKFRPKTILKKCFLRPGDILNVGNAMKTNNALAGLGNFRYVNIRFVENGTDSLGFTIMDAYIDLSRTQKQTFTTEIEGTNSSGNLGLSANLSYKNSNTFKGAEVLTIRLKGAIEAQTLISSEIEEDNILEALPFNTIETGFDAEMLFPTFLMPFTDKLFTERNAPKTSMNFGGLYQQRPDYTRTILNLSMTYEFKETAQKAHKITPFFVNLVRINPDSIFAARIEQFSRPLQTSYKDHLISGGRYSFSMSKSKSGKTGSSMLLRANFETAGNIFRLFSQTLGGAQQGQTFYIAGIRFAQYAKADTDIRRYFNFTEKTSLALRFFTGLGLPYGNIDVLPFDKRYSAGGSNDIRAWKFRSLGPGTYTDQISFDKTGDISLVMNMEYRFPIYDILYSAIFIDAGNIWMLKQYPDYPGGTFKIDEFYKQLAIGSGIGLRLNFGYFIFRLDAGIPMHDPALPEGERWVKFNKLTKRTNLNFGIGYPF